MDFLCLQVKPKEDRAPRVTMDAGPLDPLLQFHLADLQRLRLNNYQNEPENTMLDNDLRANQLANGSVIDVH